LFDADKLHLLEKKDYPSLLDTVINVLLPFVTTYLCATAFSAAAGVHVNKTSVAVENRKGTASCHFINNTAIW
jgi:hypothetical protein